MFLEKLILQALIKDIDFENSYHGEKVFVRFVWENLPEVLADYAVGLLACQQLLHLNYYRQEETMRYGMVMREEEDIEEEDEIDKRKKR